MHGISLTARLLSSETMFELTWIAIETRLDVLATSQLPLDWYHKAYGGQMLVTFEIPLALKP
jgi:hypothetical protein